MTTVQRPDLLQTPVATCRSRLRQVLEALDGQPYVSLDELMQLVDRSHCAEGHELHFATLMDGLVVANEEGRCRLGRAGVDWLDEEGRPSPNWQASAAPGAPSLRAWQLEALDAWCKHGRRGVIEAVTGTGKSRVGIEATREALSDDYSVVIAVPTRDLVEQWMASLRANSVPGVGIIGDGTPARFGRHRVLVGTVQSLYQAPPIRDDGKVLLVADECHRYGAGQWRRLLHPSYRRRLGLTATFERNDDGIKDLLTYFGGTPIYRIGFDRAIADGVVAHYDVKLLGVPLVGRERDDYDAAHETVVDSRMRLLTAGFAEEPFGLFLQQVSEAAEDQYGEEDPTVVEVARRYLKAFSDRIEVMSSAAAKMDAVRDLAPRVGESAGTLLFTRTVDAAEEIAAVLVGEGVTAEPIHSNLSRTQRRERLASLKAGRLKAVAAPTVLDEGVDVPATDLAVVLGGSKSRRQMIQRMGRVLRLKDDGRSATFIVVYAQNTVEDLTTNDGREGCLDLIVNSADSVEHLTSAAIAASPPSKPDTAAPTPASPPTSSTSTLVPPIPDPATEAPSDTRAVTASEPAALHLGHVQPNRLSMTRAALDSYRAAHDGDDIVAEHALRETLRDLCRVGMVSRQPGHQVVLVVRAHDIEVRFTADRFLRYRCRRDDGLSWAQLKKRLLVTRSLRGPEAWVDRPWPSSPRRMRVIAGLKELGSLATLVISDRALEQHRVIHGGDVYAAREDLERLLVDIEIDHDRSLCLPHDELLVGRSGYRVFVDPKLRTISGYDSAGQSRTYSDYLDLGRARRRAVRLPMDRPAEDSPLELSTPEDLLEYVDFGEVHYSSSSFQHLLPLVDEGYLNDWDIDRAVRHAMLAEVRRADTVHQLPGGSFAVQGSDLLWVYRNDGLSVAAIADPRALDRLRAHGEPVMDDRLVAPDAAERSEPDAAERSVPPQHGPSASDLAASLGDVVAQIERLVDLKERGYLTDEEFAAAKAKVLS